MFTKSLTNTLQQSKRKLNKRTRRVYSRFHRFRATGTMYVIRRSLRKLYQLKRDSIDKGKINESLPIRIFIGVDVVCVDVKGEMPVENEQKLSEASTCIFYREVEEEVLIYIGNISHLLILTLLIIFCE